MREVHIKGHVSRDHRLEAGVPADVPEGEVNVIVLVEQSDADDVARHQHLSALFARIRARVPGRSKDDIDRQIAEERASWGY
jgi:hypothetical protein